MRTDRLLWLALAGLITACTSDDDGTDTDDTTGDTDDTDSTTVDTDDTDVEPGVIRDCAADPGNICPFAGASRNGFNGDGKDKLDTWFSFPMSITFSPYGKPVIADWNNHKLRLLEDDGTVTTIMGTSFLGDGDPQALDLTEAGAPGTSVNLNHPTQQQYFPDGTLLSASWHTHKLRTWDPETGLVHVYLGNAPGWNEPGDGTPGALYDAKKCLLNQPREAHLDSDGNIFIVDMRNERVRKLDTASWEIGTVLGSGAKGACDEAAAGAALATCLNFPKNANPEPGGSIAFNADESVMYIADTESHIIRAMDMETGTVTILAGTAGQAGDVDDTGAAARFNFPAGLAIDGDTLFVADANNHKVRAVDVTTGAVTTFAGTGEPTCPITGAIATPSLCDDQFLAGDGGPAAEATLYRPFGVTIDLDGNLVIADTYNHRFRIVYR